MIRGNKFQLHNAKVFLHYDEKNQDLHIDLKIPKHNFTRKIPNEGKWYYKQNKNKNTQDIAIILFREEEK